MKPIYEEITNSLGETIIKRTDANEKVWWIPTDPSNSDYQRYLEEQANDQSL
jgi:hypothetical protein